MHTQKLSLLALLICTVLCATLAKADTLYTSLILSNGMPASMSFNAYGVGEYSVSTSIEFSTPFKSPAFSSIVQDFRIPLSIESGPSKFIFTLYADNNLSPGISIFETTVDQQLQMPRSGSIDSHWIDILPSSSPELTAETLYWVSVRAIPGTGSSLDWLRPTTDISTTNAYRNLASADTSWNPYTYDSPAIEVLGVPATVPEPSTEFLVALGFLLLFAIRLARNESKGL